MPNMTLNDPKYSPNRAQMALMARWLYGRPHGYWVLYGRPHGYWVLYGRLHGTGSSTAGYMAPGPVLRPWVMYYGPGSCTTALGTTAGLELGLLTSGR